MKKLVIRWLVYAAAIYFAAWILPGISVKDFWAACITAAALAIVNMFLRPIIVAITLPVTIITLGLFIFAINAIMLLIASDIVDGFHVDDFWWAVLGSLIISAIYKFVMGKLYGEKIVVEIEKDDDDDE